MAPGEEGFSACHAVLQGQSTLVCYSTRGATEVDVATLIESNFFLISGRLSNTGTNQVVQIRSDIIISGKC